jgi:hypothetical protein
VSSEHWPDFDREDWMDFVSEGGEMSHDNNAVGFGDSWDGGQAIPSAMMRNEVNTNNKTSKIKLYGWELKDAPGKLTFISKDALFVDHSYQRKASQLRVIAIAQKWSWLACGVILVAKRKGDQRLYVVDGQHRVLAALKRSDIDVLPCLVFETGTAHEEAAGFYDANTGRRMPTTLEKWRAQLMRGDETTMFVDALIRNAGRVASGVTGPGEVRCLTAMLRAATSNRDRLVRMWPLIVEVCHGHVFHERVFEGLMWLESNLPEGQSLTQKKWREKLMRVGFTGLLDAAQRAATFYARGGPKVWAMGMLEALNKGCRIHMTLREDSPA